MMRLTAYAGSSVALATAVLCKALNQRVNFYSACVYLSQSNACVIVLVNLLVLIIGTCVFGLQRILYGPLRPVEAEQLYDRAWFAITETCLAMTMFREEIGVWFILLFISLLVGKAWAWIGEGRVEILDQQPPANPRLFHIRLSTSLFLSLMFDLYFLDYSVSSVRHQARPTMMVMFAFEFAVLTAVSASTSLRYMISLREDAIRREQIKQRMQEIRDERRRAQQELSNNDAPEANIDDDIDEADLDVPGWEDKGRWVFYLELLTDIVRLVLYLTFFCVLCVFYGLPIYIIRDVAMAIRSTYKRISDFAKYKHATRDMNERYRDATAEDIHENDVCIICRELMRPWQPRDEATPQQGIDQRLRPKKLPCGHILHFACLRSWLERQQICPTCRQPVLGDSTNNGRSNQQQQRNQQDRLRGPAAPNVPGPDHDRAQADANRPLQPARDQNEFQQNPAAQPQADNPRRHFQLGPFRLDWGRIQADPNQPVQPRAQADEASSSQPQRAATPGPSNLQPRYSRPATNPMTVEASTMQLQIDMIEQQVLQQINSLRVTVSHLSRIRASQEELVRLHGLQHGGAPPSVQVFRSDPSRRPLSAGSEALPTGLVLPQGWSLLPLGRTSSSAVHAGATPRNDRSRTPSEVRPVPAQTTHPPMEQANRHVSVPSEPSGTSLARTPVPHSSLEGNSGVPSNVVHTPSHAGSMLQPSSNETEALSTGSMSQEIPSLERRGSVAEAATIQNSVSDEAGASDTSGSE